MNLSPSPSSAAWLRETRAVVRLAAPLALSHLSYMAIMLTDVVMMGRIGTKDTAMPMMIALATGWGMGLPTAVVLGFALDLGGPGIWAGMAVAMTGAAWLLIRRFRRQARLFAAQA